MRTIRFFTLFIASVAIMLPTFLLATPLVVRQVGASEEAVLSADTTKKVVEKAPEIAQKGAADNAINADSIAPIGGRLGLVLSGGGAKGLYHIGVIRALEDVTSWKCTICGYIYEGDTLPEDFICPLCKHGAADFSKLA